MSNFGKASIFMVVIVLIVVMLFYTRNEKSKILTR